MTRAVQSSDFKLYALLSEPSFSPDGKRVAFSSRRANLQDDAYDSDVMVSDLKAGSTTVFTTGKKDSDPRWSPDGRSILFLSKRHFGKDEKGNALYTIGAAGGEARLLHKSKEGVDNPQWSPDSRTIYFLSYVSKPSKDDVKVIRRLTFWFNGSGYVYGKRKHLFACDVASGKVSQLTKGALDVSDFAPSHGGKKVAYLASDDDIKPYISDLHIMDLRSRRTSKVTRSDMEIHGLAWRPNDAEVALLGDDLPAGFASHERIWVANLGSRKVVLIDDVDRNKGNALNSDARAKSHGPSSLLWDKQGIYFVQADGPSVHLYRMVPGKQPELVVGGERSVEGFDVRSGDVAFVAMDSQRLEELHLKSGKETIVTSLNSGVYKQVRVLAPSQFSFRASDGEKVEGWVLLPRTKRRVPGVLYVHGGPKTAFGHAYMHEFQTFAGAGYAVIYLNPRGSDGYTEKFADIRGRYGTRDFDDLMEGLDYALKAFPQIDGKRLAIAGGSYGGFMTNWAVGHTDRFAAGVADRSIASWVSMWGTSDIGPYFTSDQIGGDPWDAEEKLLNDSPLRYAPNVKTPLLLVHSMEDYRCWMVEGVQFFTALKRLGKEVEMVLFPGENHDLSRVGKPKHRVARLGHYLRWFDSHLKSRS